MNSIYSNRGLLKRRGYMLEVIEWIKGHIILTTYFSVSTLLILILISYLFLQVPEKTESNDDAIEQFVTENEKAIDMNTEDENQQKNQEITESKVIIELKGAIVHPGVYELESGDRLIDVVDQAGGFTDNADDRTINQALLLTDQMMVYIPVQGEESIEENQIILSTLQGDRGKININQAEQKELLELKGIGEAKAQAIIDYREENGLFKSLEELKNVSGIGDKIFENIKDSIMVE